MSMKGSKYCVFCQVYVFGKIRIQSCLPWSLIGTDMFDFFSAEFDETWQQVLNVFYQICVFRADRNTKIATWPLLAETFWTSLQPLNGIWWRDEVSSPRPLLPKFVIFELIENQRSYWLWEVMAWTPVWMMTLVLEIIHCFDVMAHLWIKDK